MGRSAYFTEPLGLFSRGRGAVRAAFAPAARAGSRSRRFVCGVIAMIALFVALGPSAYATHLVLESDDIANGDVKTPDLADAAVSNPKLDPDAVGSRATQATETGRKGEREAA